ncbi:hypothetical protein CXG81DRAFT_20571 [Caulochytrium protostelioides]|uniref:Uncharacterized protein n=1 Tax=Caulochytrium protostelioides TaxID=1555241 RepID=A0A4P9X2D3_9FUNG|nr:hypothetical protein CXG81DRAFT_20571 [Caulochytrium protostelioides]|eukprot:RKO99333.1 hypothetical protein CXG81DRAFT_20571 [Caulochytrium protostelioides]
MEAPSSATASSALAAAPAGPDAPDLAATFRHAAAAVTQLYKESTRQSRQSFEQGYTACLRHLAQFCSQPTRGHPYGHGHGGAMQPRTVGVTELIHFLHAQGAQLSEASGVEAWMSEAEAAAAGAGVHGPLAGSSSTPPTPTLPGSAGAFGLDVATARHGRRGGGSGSTSGGGGSGPCTGDGDTSVAGTDPSPPRASLHAPPPPPPPPHHHHHHHHHHPASPHLAMHGPGQAHGTSSHPHPGHAHLRASPSPAHAHPPTSAQAPSPQLYPGVPWKRTWTSDPHLHPGGPLAAASASPGAPTLSPGARGDAAGLAGTTTTTAAAAAGLRLSPSQLAQLHLDTDMDMTHGGDLAAKRSRMMDLASGHPPS